MLAGRSSAAFFHADTEIAQRLNDVQRRLRHANERLWSGLSPDAFGFIYDGVAPAGESRIAKLVSDALSSGGSGPEAAVLRALQETHWLICAAFHDYQGACGSAASSPGGGGAVRTAHRIGFPADRGSCAPLARPVSIGFEPGVLA